MEESLPGANRPIGVKDCCIRQTGMRNGLAWILFSAGIGHTTCIRGYQPVTCAKNLPSINLYSLQKFISVDWAYISCSSMAKKWEEKSYHPIRPNMKNEFFTT